MLPRRTPLSPQRVGHIHRHGRCGSVEPFLLSCSTLHQPGEGVEALVEVREVRGVEYGVHLGRRLTARTVAGHRQCDRDRVRRADHVSWLSSETLVQVSSERLDGRDRGGSGTRSAEVARDVGERDTAPRDIYGTLGRGGRLATSAQQRRSRRYRTHQAHRAKHVSSRQHADRTCGRAHRLPFSAVPPNSIAATSSRVFCSRRAKGIGRRAESLTGSSTCARARSGMWRPPPLRRPR